MNKQTTLEQLINIGLEKIEAQIYLYLLENGPHTHLELSRETNTNRSKIYRYVEKLTQKNLLVLSVSSRGKKLLAASPQNIKLLIQNQEEAIKTKKEKLPFLIKNLSTLPSYTAREFEIKHYRGQEGLRQMLWNHLQAKREIHAFSYKNKNDIVGKPYADKIRQEQMDRQITLYELENETDQGDYSYTSVRGWEKYYKSLYIPPKTLDIKQYIAIFNDTVSIINWLDDEEVGLEIINSPYAELQRQLFKKFWNLTKQTSSKKTKKS